MEREIDLALIKTSGLDLRQPSVSIKGELEISSTLFIVTFVSLCFSWMRRLALIINEYITVVLGRKKWSGIGFYLDICFLFPWVLCKLWLFTEPMQWMSLLHTIYYQNSSIVSRLLLWLNQSNGMESNGYQYANDWLSVSICKVPFCVTESSVLTV